MLKPNRKRHRRDRRDRRHIFETLEKREMLAAENVFAQFASEIAAPNEPVSIPFSFGASDLVSMKPSLYLGFHASRAEGSSLDPGEISIRDSEGNLIAPFYIDDDTMMETASLAIAPLSRGDYSVEVTGEDNSTGSFTLEVFLAGDADGDMAIARGDHQLIQQGYGKRRGENGYVIEADANLDGRITVFDMSIWQRNRGGPTNQAPSIVAGLKNDTAPGEGNTNDDKITSDATVSGTVTDLEGNEIVQLSAALNDSEQFQDVLSTLNPDGRFEFDSSVLQLINEGVSLEDGKHVLRVQATDSVGLTSEVFELEFTLDTTPPEVSFDLTETSDTGERGDLETELAEVEILVTAEAGAAVSFDLPALSQDAPNRLRVADFADESGDLLVPNVSLAVGANPAAAIAVDLAGNENEASAPIVRIDNTPNQAPVFQSDPIETFRLPEESNPIIGDVSPELIDIDLLNELVSQWQVSLTLPEEDTSVNSADIVLVVDESLSMTTEHRWIYGDEDNPGLLRELEAALLARGVGANRYAMLGFGPAAFPALGRSETRTFNATGGPAIVSVFDSLGNLIESKQFDPATEFVAGNTRSLPSGAFTELEAVLPETGQYIVTIAFDEDSGPVGYGFQLLTPGTSTTELTLGETVEADLAVAGERDAYTFSVDSPTNVYFDSMTDTARLFWTLEGPDGTLMDSRAFDRSEFSTGLVGNTTVTGENPIVTLTPGDYRLTVDGNDDFTTDYSFRLVDITEDSSRMLLEEGVAASSTLTSETQSDLYRFTADAGDRLFFDIVQTSDIFSTRLRLIDQHGTPHPAFTDANLIDLEGVDLFNSGEYTLLVEPDLKNLDVTSYELAYHVVDRETISLDSSSSNTISGEIANPGDTDQYTFTLASDGLLHFDSLTNSSDFLWSLDGPGQYRTQKRFDRSDGSPGSLLDLRAGSYTLSVDAAGDATGLYDFRLLDLSNASQLEPGIVTDATLSPGNESQLYRFQVATPGDVLSLDLTGANLASQRVIDPLGNQISFRNDLRNNTLPSLYMDGDYYLLIEGQIGQTEDLAYSVNLQQIDNDPAPPFSGFSLTLNTFEADVSGTLATSGEVDSYRVQINSRSLVYFDALTNSGSLDWKLETEDGIELESRSFNRSDARSDSVALDLKPAIYFLTIENASAAAQDYALRLLNLNFADQRSLNEAISSTLSPANSVDAYSFDTSGGEEVFFDVEVDIQSGGAWRLIDPAGLDVFSRTTLTDEAGTHVLSHPGRYTLIVEGAIGATEEKDYAVQLWTVDETTTPIQLGHLDEQIVNGRIDTPQDRDVYTFELLEDTTIYVDSLTNRGDVRWTLSGLSGVVEADRAFSTTDTANNAEQALYQLVAGEYSFLVQPGSNGDLRDIDYSFRITDLSSLLIPEFVRGEQVDAELSPGNETQFYSFEASEGESFFLDISVDFGSRSLGDIRIVDSSGRQVFFDETLIDQETFTAPRTGSYTLLVEGEIGVDSPVDYSIALLPKEIEETQLFPTEALSVRQSGSIESAGQRDSYIFSLTGDKLFYFDSLTDRDDLTWTLTGPLGAVVDGKEFGANSGPDLVLELIAGDYTLTVDGAGDATGAYEFSFFALDTASALTIGTDQDAGFNTLGSTQAFKFQGSAGEQFYLDLLDVSAGVNVNAVRWDLLDSLGRIAAGVENEVLRDVDTFTLPDDGAYTLLLRSNFTQTVPFDVTFNLRQVEGVTQTLPDDGETNGTLAIGQSDTYTFHVDETRHVLFDALTLDASLRWSLDGPQGSIFSQTFNVSLPTTTPAANPVLRLAPGEYTLSIDGSNDHAGDYALRLLDLATRAEQNSITVGTPFGQTAAEPRSVNVYRLDALAGDEFRFDVDETMLAGSFQWQLVDPSGDQIFRGNSLRDVDSTGNLALSGPHYLIVRSVSASVGSYSIDVEHLGNVTPEPVNGQDIELGELVSTSLIGGETEASFFFTLEEEQQVLFDALSAEGRWSLSGPAGVEVARRRLDQSDADGFADSPVLTLTPGDYQLTVGELGSASDFGFRLLDLNAEATSIPPGSLQTDTLNPAAETHVYQFQGTAGKEVFLDILASDNAVAASVRLLGQYGEQLLQLDDLEDAKVTLDRDATYTLLFEGKPGTTAANAYSFRILSTQEDQAALQLNSPTIGTISAPGNRKVHTFDLAEVTQFFFDGANAADNRLRVTLLDPAGDIVFDESLQADVGPFHLTRKGEYSLIVEGEGDAAGEYEFEFSKIDDTQALPQNVRIDGELVQGRAAHVFQVDGQAGQRLFFETLDTHFGSADQLAETAEGFLATNFAFPLEDGYLGIDRALSTFEFRPDAARNLILITDEDRDNVDASLDFDSILTDLLEKGVVLNSVVIAGFEDFQGDALLGSDFEGTFYVPDGSGGFTTTTAGQIVPDTVFGDVVSQYVDLAFATDGAAWDLSLLEAGDDIVASFTKAIAEIKADEIIRQLGIDIIASDNSVQVVNNSGPQLATGGVPANFDIEITGDGAARSFDLQFVRTGTGNIVGSIPVRMVATYQYTALAEDPDGDPITYSFEGPDDAIFDPNTRTITWRPQETGVYDFKIIASDGKPGGIAEQPFQVVVTDTGNNRDPQIESSPQTKGVSGEAYEYQVIATDPEDNPLQYFGVNLPAGMTMNRTTGLLTWDANQVVNGEHPIQVRVIDGFGGQATQEYTLGINWLPEIISRPKTDASVGDLYEYQVDIRDRDSGDTHTYLIDSPPGDLEINPSTGFISWEGITVADIGTYPITVRVVDSQGGAAVPQEFDLIVGADQEAPTVTLTVQPGRVEVGDSVQVRITATDNVAIDSLVLTRNGMPMAINDSSPEPELFTAQFAIPASEVGLVTLVATASDADGNSATADAQYSVFNAAIDSFPTVELTRLSQLRFSESPLDFFLPDDQIVVSYLTDIFGSVTVEPGNALASYRVEYARADLVRIDPSNIALPDPDYVVLASGTDTIQNANLATFDPTLLANDDYVIRLIATDVAGRTAAEVVTVGVEGNAKIGNFFFEVTDLSIPVTGIPIEIIRSYDTLNAGEVGSFGHGWNLRFQDADIRETVPDNGGGFFSQEPFKEGTRVYLNDPDGNRIGFTFQPIPGGSIGAGDVNFQFFTPHFEPDPGVYATLKDPRISGAALVRLTDGTFGGFAGAGNYNPDVYELTTKEGIQYRYHEDDGLQRVTDLNGNMLDFRDDGIFSSTGEAVQFIRDDEDRITEIIDTAGNSLFYEYDAVGDLVAFTNQAELTTCYTYFDKPAHYLETIIDPMGRVAFRAEFDENSRLTSTTDALGNSVSQDYDVRGFTGTIRDAEGNVTELLYNDRGNILEETDPAGNTTFREYEDPDNPDLETRIIDRRGMVVDREYDPLGNVTMIAERGPLTAPFAEPLVTEFTYGDFSNVTSIENARRETTTFGYDDRANLERIENAVGDTARFEYDELGRVRFSWDFKGNRTEFLYDGEASQPFGVILPDGVSRQFLLYNQFGQVIRETFLVAGGEIQEERLTTYDAIGRVTSEEDGEGNIRRMEYEGNNLVREILVNPETLESTTDPTKSPTTQFFYDDTDRLLRQIDAEGGVTEFRYDANGNRILLQDPVGNITTWLYDGLDRVIEERDPFYNEGMSIEEALAALEVPSGASTVTDTAAEHVRVFGYDGEGNRIEAIDRNGRRREFDYDPAGRLEEERWFEGTSSTLLRSLNFTYDAVGNMLSAVDPQASYVFEYDALNRLDLLTIEYLTAEPGFPTVTLDYEYDKQGNVRLVQDNLGAQVDSVYDERNLLESRLWSGSDVDEARVDFEYNAARRVSHIDRFADLAGTNRVGSTDFVYDLAGRVDQLTHRDALDQMLADYDYGYDFSGVLTSEIRTHQDSQFNQSISYGYDLTAQLIDAVYSGQDDEQYDYDANGNRLGGGNQMEAANQLSEDGDFRYEYDGEGNLIKKVDISGTSTDGEVIANDYDHRNRLIRVDRWSQEPSEGGVLLSSSEYEYDAFDRRIAKLVDADGARPGGVEVTRFLYNGDNVWVDFNGQGEIIARYLFGDRIDQILARYRPGEGVAWYLTDRLGTVRDLMDAAGQLLNHVEYDSFGKVLFQTNSAASDRFLFQGRELDSETGLYYFRARYFDPSTGRFVSRDPIGFEAGDNNLFRFVLNSPLNGTDPTGTTLLRSVSVAVSRVAPTLLRVTALALLVRVAVAGGASQVEAACSNSPNPPLPLSVFFHSIGCQITRGFRHIDDNLPF